MNYTNINIPAHVACDADRTHVYLLLMTIAVCDFTDDDHADWLYATGWRMRRVSL